MIKIRKGVKAGERGKGLKKNVVGREDQKG